MAAPSGIVWGSTVGSYGRIGIYTTISKTNTEAVIKVQVWFWSKYSVSDTSNMLYFTLATSESSATGEIGSKNINTTVASGSGWSTSNQVLLYEYTHSTIARGTSAKTRYLYAKLANVDRVGGTMYASTTVTVPKLDSYTVTYKANGGSGAPSSQTKYHGVALTLSSTKPTRTGYTFKGWGTSSSSTTVAYAAGASYTSNASVTLYAIWTAKTYTVKYDSNGGSGAPSSQTKTHDVALTLSGTKPTRTGYTFKGWGTSSGSTTVAYAAGASYTSNASVTLYAIWTESYTKPRITDLKVERCDSNGTPTQDGTYALVKCNWETDKTVSSVKINWKLSTESSYPSGNTSSVSASGTVGNVSKIVGSGALDTLSSYDIQVLVIDSDGMTPKTVTLASMHFTLHLKNGGNGVAIGKISEYDDTFECVYEMKLHKTIYSEAGACLGGKQVSNDGKTGIVLSSNGGIVVQHSTTPYIDFFYNTDTTRKARISASSSGSFIIENSTGQLPFTSTQLRTNKDDTFYLGGSSYRWKEIYSMKSANNTSDRNQKENIVGISKKYEELFSMLKPVTYEFKGSEHDRIHVGFIAQDVKEAMDEIGLSDLDFAAYCMDIKTEYDEEKDEDVVVLDENGKPVEMYALRYAEFIALNTHMIQKQQTEIEELKKEIKGLKALIKGTYSE